MSNSSKDCTSCEVSALCVPQESVPSFYECPICGKIVLQIDRTPRITYGTAALFNHREIEEHILKTTPACCAEGALGRPYSCPECRRR